MVEVALRPRSSPAFLLEWQRGVNWPILLAAFVLIGVGLTMALAAGPPAAARLGYADSFFFVKRQVGFAAVAAIVLIC
ncbi:MAG: cell division protein FtsW, partial [Pseudomonadota bacterium]